jgi:hypothetical protein
VKDWEFIKWELEAVFEDWGLSVAVGLKPGGGIVIRSQDDQVDASNLGTVVAQREETDE